MASSPSRIICSSCREELDEKFVPVSKDGSKYCYSCYVNKTEQADLTRLQLEAQEPQAGPSHATDDKATLPFGAKPKVHWSSLSGKRKSFFSKKPLRCPESSCRKTISVLSFVSHCEYEHKAISIITTKPEYMTSIDLDPTIFKYDRTYCLMILQIPCFSLPADEVQLSSDSKGILKDSTIPAITLMGSRISGKRVKDVNAGRVDILLDQYPMPSIRMDPVSAKIMHIDDVMIFWVASNFRVKKNYTLCVSTTDDRLQQKYYGPIRSMSTTNLDMFAEGDGLTLIHFHINRMTAMGTKPIVIDVVVHNK